MHKCLFRFKQALFFSFNIAHVFDALYNTLKVRSGLYDVTVIRLSDVSRH